MQFIDQFMVDRCDFAEMFSRAEHIAGLVEVPAHADRTVIPIRAMNTTWEIPSSDISQSQKSRRMNPNICETAFIAIPQNITAPSSTWIIIPICGKAHAAETSTAYFFCHPCFISLKFRLFPRTEKFRIHRQRAKYYILQNRPGFRQIQTAGKIADVTVHLT